LLFGDSLTEGFYNRGLKFHPYSVRLAQLLDPEKYVIKNHGISGEETSEMVTRFEMLISGNEFSYAIILGGTNDMGERNAKGTFNNLKKMYEAAKKKGVIPFAVTVPEHHQELVFEWLTDVRSTINKLIKEYCEQNQITVIDLCAKLPQLSLRADEKKLYWDDGLHFTPAGYNRFGEIVHETIKSQLEL